MRADELLEGGDLLGPGVDAADERQVADVRDLVEPAHLGRGHRPERGERVVAGDRVVGEPISAARPEDDGPVALAAHEDEPEPGWAARSATSPGCAASSGSSVSRPGSRSK
jgi:hypothetical protein